MENKNLDTPMARKKLAKLYDMTYEVFRNALKTAVGIKHGKRLSLEEIEMIKEVFGDPSESYLNDSQMKRQPTNFKTSMTRGDLADLYQTNHVTFRHALRNIVGINHSRKLWTKDIERIKAALGDPTKFYSEES